MEIVRSIPRRGFRAKSEVLLYVLVRRVHLNAFEKLISHLTDFILERGEIEAEVHLADFSTFASSPYLKLHDGLSIKSTFSPNFRL